MKKISLMICIALIVGITSCDDYLDINTNTNKATATTPDLVLPQALAATALAVNQYNSYGMQIGGYAANAGGFGAFNELVSYAYTPNNYNLGATSLWAMTYDNLEDYQYIINSLSSKSATPAAQAAGIYYSAVAKIMKAYNFQLLVDTYNDVPYDKALLGADNLTPVYDSGPIVYAKLGELLDEAIAEINSGKVASPAPIPLATNDIVFAGNVDSWLKLANTIKLRLMIRGKGKVTFTNTTFDPAGFLTTDALVNPGSGYTRDNNKQNPKWNSWAFTYTGTSATKAWLPTTWIMSFYNGFKLNDPGRGAAMYYQFPTTGTNQLGFESTGIPKSPEGNFWYPGADRVGTTAGGATGVLKGPNAPFPLFTAAESYFLQAEAALPSVAIAPGTPKTLFNAGITASFKYLYMLPDGTTSGNPTTAAASYIAANADRLVQYDLATTPAQQLEAIITQKYIALNMVNSQEGWNEYRRTGYPAVSGTGPTSTFASTASQSTRPDRLPSRILYPISELQYNPVNVPTGVNSFTSLIFWAK